MDEPKKKCRQYDISYLKYGFIQSSTNKTLPMCLICQKVFSNESMKPSRLQDHLTRVHSDKKDKNLSFFQAMKEKILKQPTLGDMFSSVSKQDNDGLHASYNISLLIAKSGKAHTIGEELILPSIAEVLRTVLHIPTCDIIKKIPLSNNTVQRRIDNMSLDLEISLCDFLKTAEFSLQIDESTLPTNEALLLGYVRFIREEKMCQEMLIAKLLLNDTKGESIFREVKNFFIEKDIPLSNVISVATDGAPVMIGRYRGFTAFFKKSVPNLIAVHCVIHRQHLVSKQLSKRLHTSLYFVIEAVNKIRRYSLQDRLFSELCIDNDEDFNRLLLHTEVRWLSKGKCLNRFYKLFDSVVEFFENKEGLLRKNLIKSKADIAYLTDLFNKFNEMNLQLQGDDLNLIRTKSVISAFISKLLLYKRNFELGNFSQFFNLSAMKIDDENIFCYCEHLGTLCQDFNNRFEDILTMTFPDWLLDPFSSINNEDSLQLQEELIELSTNQEIKFKFKNGYQHFWMQKQIPKLYPGLWEKIKMFLVAFPSSYSVERGFSAVMYLMSKNRNKLQIVDRGDLRLFLTNRDPDIDKIIAEHQVHPSH